MNENCIFGRLFNSVLVRATFAVVHLMPDNSCIVIGCSVVFTLCSEMWCGMVRCGERKERGNEGWWN